VLATIGCRPEDDVTSAFSPSNADSTDATADARASNVVIEHDFGVVLSRGEALRHRFAVRNDTDDAWTFRQIRAPCACTVGELDSPTIAAHSTGYVTVTYHPPSSTKDDARFVYVVFREPGAPVVRLLVTARCRLPMTVSTDALAIHAGSRGKDVQTTFEVENFSGEDWRTLDVRGRDEWLTAASSLVRSGSKEREPRQVWRVDVCALCSALPPGRHESQLAVEARGAQPESQIVPVSLEIPAPVEATPRQLFYGTVARGTGATRRLLIRFGSDVPPPPLDEISIHSDLGHDLDFAWINSQGNVWSLDATIRSEAHEGFLKGSVCIEFATREIPSIEIPVLALVGQGD